MGYSPPNKNTNEKHSQQKVDLGSISGKAVWAQFKADDLTNLSALYDSLLSVSSDLDLIGRARHFQHRTAATEGWIFSVAVTPIEFVTGTLKSEQMSQVIKDK